MAYNPPDNIQSDPLCRKTIHSIHPVEAAGIITAKSYGGRHGHTKRYVIVNEHEPRKKLLRSATRIPRHYLMKESAEILELYPRNIKRYTPRSIYHQPHPHRSHQSQQHLSVEEDKVEERKGKRRMSFGRAYCPPSLSDLEQQARFYIGDCLDSHMSTADNGTTRERYEEKDDKTDWEEDIDLEHTESHSQFQSNLRKTNPLVRTRHHIHSPGRQYKPTARTGNMDTYVKPKTRPKLETPLTESDSASLASSSDQQNSSTDQYIQVIHNKEHYLKADARQGKLAKKKSKTNFDSNFAESNDLVSSNV